MTDYLWSKGAGEGPDAAVQDYLAGEDVALDRQLFLFDIQGTVAHVRGLTRIGILSEEEAGQVVEVLSELAQRFSAGDYRLGPPFEDGHSAIEAYVSERLGEVGRKIHAGRSRNDQVQTALRLYMKARLAELKAVSVRIATVCADRAENMREWAMPGYTHLQRAVPSSVGLWLAAYAEGYADIAALAGITHDWIDQSPLGTAAGFGVNLPLDREGVAAELGFARLQINPMYVQSSRGRFEVQVLSAFAQATLELRRLAWDLSLYCTPEFGFVRLPPRWVTGSSIMPNKSNPDVVELMRAQHARVQGAMSEIQAVVSLPSAYHRDLQATKGPLIRSIESTLRALRLLPELLADLELDRERMAAAIDGPMYATDQAIEQALEGTPFRDAYRNVAPAQLDDRSPQRSIAERVSPGATADLRLDEIRRRIDTQR